MRVRHYGVLCFVCLGLYLLRGVLLSTLNYEVPNQLPTTPPNPTSTKKYTRDVLRDDPSLSVRCPCAVQYREVIPPDPLSLALSLPTDWSTIYTMTIHGETSDASKLIPTTFQHHPIFEKYVTKMTNSIMQYPNFISEFTRVLVKESFDCDSSQQGTAGDFRKYHLSRAVACNEKKSNGTKGFLPITDEEYFEHIALLTTAFDAATKGERYIAIELGARYGTWAVRAGGAYRAIAGSDNFFVVAMEADCEWFCRMQDHVAVNSMTDQSALVLAYNAPRSYNKVHNDNPTTFKSSRTVSLLDLLEPFEVVHLIDFDIQGWESINVDTEPEVVTLLTKKAKWLHFGTHSKKAEMTLLNAFQSQGWCVLYYFSGGHHKALNRGHFCQTPYGKIGYNDGSLGLVNSKFYPEVASRCEKVPRSKRCFWSSDVLKILTSV